VLLDVEQHLCAGARTRCQRTLVCLVNLSVSECHALKNMLSVGLTNPTFNGSLLLQIVSSNLFALIATVFVAIGVGVV